MVVPTYNDARSLVRIWPVGAETAKPEVRLPAGIGVYAARFDRQGRRIVYVDTEGRIAVRDLASGRETVLEGGPETVYDAPFTPDGERVAAVPESGTLFVWRLDRPDGPERKLTGHRGHLNGLAIGNDGRMATAGSDRTVRIWPAKAGNALVLRGHEGEVSSVTFTADGTQLVSAGLDGSVRLWDARSGAALAILHQGDDEIYDVVIDPHDRIATLGAPEILRVFECAVCGPLGEVRRDALASAPRRLDADERQRFLATTGG
jgi:WD40 repeat protein